MEKEDEYYYNGKYDSSKKPIDIIDYIDITKIDEEFKNKIDSIKPDNLICMINKGSVKQNIEKLIIGFNRNNSITIAKAAEKLHKENKQYYDKCGIKMEEN